MRSDTGVVVPAYNAASTLRECLKSILAQGVPGSAICVADNASNDDTAEIARSCGVRVVEAPRRGPAAARNAALSILGRYEYVLMVDADVALPARWLERAVRVLEMKGDVGGLSGRALARGGSPAELALQASLWGCRCSISEAVEVHSLATMAVLWRRTAIFELRFREDLTAGEDPEFAFRVRERGWRLLWSPDLWFRHQHPVTMYGVVVKWFRYGRWYLAPYLLHPAYVSTEVVMRVLFLPLGVALTVVVVHFVGQTGICGGLLLVASTGFLNGLPDKGLPVRTRLGVLQTNSLRFISHQLGMWLGLPHLLMTLKLGQDGRTCE